jgi:hypothetical protein
MQVKRPDAPCTLQSQLRSASWYIDVVGSPGLGDHAGLARLFAVRGVEVYASLLVDRVDVLDDVGAEVVLLRDLPSTLTCGQRAGRRKNIYVVAVAGRELETVQRGGLGRTWDLCSRWTCRSSRQSHRPAISVNVAWLDFCSDVQGLRKA